MLGLNAGTAYVSIKPDLRGMHSSVATQLRTTDKQFATAGTTAGTSYQKSFGKRFLGGLGTIAKRGALTLGTIGIVGGAAIAKSSIKLEQEFGSTMSQIGAATEAPKRQLRAMSDLALKMGADTVFSANESSAAMLELAKGGMSAATIQAGGLKGTLQLAAAGGTDMATAAMIASDALNVFNLRGSQMKNVAAALAGGANASSASVESLGLAMSQAGLSAADAGLSVQETVATLAAFDNAGLKGSDAGTSLKTALSRLVPTTKEAYKAFSNYGLVQYDANKASRVLAQDGIQAVSNKYVDVYDAVSAYLVKQGVAEKGTVALADATEDYLRVSGVMHNSFLRQNGDYKSIAQIAGILQDKLGGLSQSERDSALMTMFGSDARRAATVLMREGERGLARYIKKTSDLGAAQRMADSRMKGTAGAIEKMKGSLETAGLSIGIALRPATIAISNLVADLANRAIPYIQHFGDWLRKAMRGDNIFTSIADSVRGLLPQVREVGDVAPAVMRGLTGTDVKQPADRLDDMRRGLQKIVQAFVDAKRELPSFSDVLRVSGVVLGFLADNADTVAKLMPWLVAGFVAVKTAQIAGNAAAAVSVPLRIAEMVANRRLAASNAQLVATIRAQTASTRGSTIAEATNTGAKNAGATASVRSRLATVGKTIAERASAAASKAMAAATWLVNAALRANPIGIVITALIALGAAVVLAYRKSETFRQIVQGAWDKIKAAVAFAWENVIKPAFKALGWYIEHVLAPVFRFLWENVVKPVFGWIGDKVVAVWNNVIKPAFAALGDFIRDKVAPAFRKGVDAIGRAWDWLKSAATRPINFIIDTVYNNGIRKFVNGLLDRFGIDTRLPYVQPIGAAMSGGRSGRAAPGLQEFATGGVVLPGYTPGRDVHTFVSPTTGRKLRLSGGEAVMRPEWTRAVGGPREVARQNRDAMHGRLGRSAWGFAGGGTIPAVGTWTRHTSGYPWASYAGDINVPGGGDYGNPVRAYDAGTVAFTKSLATSYGNHIGINHLGGTSTLYAHLSRMLVRAGEQVARGALIGRVGSTGNSTGPHLHFEIKGGHLTPGATDTGKSWTEKLVTKFADWAADKGKSLVGGIPGAGVFTDVARGLGNKAIDGIRNWIVERWGGGVDGGAIPKGPVVEVARRLAAQRGWTGAQWAALSELVSRESSWNPNAQNPTSSAYGLFQFLDSTWASVGGRKTSDPGKQIAYGLAYIAQRYGTPVGALRFHDAHNWYDRGGWLPHGGVARNNSGKPEPVFTDKQWRLLKQAITRQTLGGGAAITGEWLAELLSRMPKGAGELRQEFVRARDALRGFREDTLRAREALDDVRKSERYRQARFELRRIEARLEDQRSLRAVRTDMASARRDLVRARRRTRGGEALAEYRRAGRALEAARTPRELKQAEREQNRRRRDAERQLKRADTDAAKRRARAEIEAADKRLKAIDREGTERERLQRRYERAAKAEPVAELAKARERLKRLRKERERIRELRKARREAADAKPLQRYERLQERLNKRVEDEKRARDRAKRAAEAYKAAQEAAIERARGIYETGTALGGIEAAPSKTSGGIVANLRRAVATVKSWRGIVGKLIGAGLRGPILDEFISAGPSVDAVRLGKSLLAGGQIAEIMRLQEQLRRESVAAGARGARFYRPKPVAGARRASALPANAVAASAAGRTYQIVYSGMPADTVETIVHKTTQRVRYEIGREATL